LVVPFVAVLTWVGARYWFVRFAGPKLVDEDLRTQFEKQFGGAWQVNLFFKPAVCAPR
jgi:hypothetical protein